MKSFLSKALKQIGKHGQPHCLHRILFVGVTGPWELQLLQGVLFLLIYLGALSGNLITVTLVVTDTRLHSPMYFFISSLCLLDLSSISAIVPKTVVNSLVVSKRISLTDCTTQMFFYVLFEAVEFVFVVIMSYDCFFAICHPLHYGPSSSQVCAPRPQLACGPLVWSTLLSTQVLSSGFPSPRPMWSNRAVLSPIAQKSSFKNPMTAVFYTTVPPFLNPIIYCLHNREINAALGRMFSRCSQFPVKGFLD
nr:olfactory receptor 14I1-like [Cavia porcellus]